MLTQILIPAETPLKSLIDFDQRIRSSGIELKEMLLFSMTSLLRLYR